MVAIAHTYDVFISYSHKDQAWVDSQLMPRLEGAGLKNSNFRDSRGLSRARNGDYEEAIEDFMTFVVDPTNPSGERSNRQKWIERLKNNANPFTADVLESLR